MANIINRKYFSKFHYSINNEGRLCFLFAFDKSYFGDSSLLSIKLLRRDVGVAGTTNTSKKDTDVYNEISLRGGYELKTKIGEGINFFQGMDSTVEDGRTYEYTVYAYAKIEDRKDEPSFINARKHRLHVNINRIEPKIATLKYSFPFVEVQKKNIVNVDFEESLYGFNLLSSTAAKESVLDAAPVEFGEEQKKVFIQRDSFKPINKFLRTRTVSKNTENTKASGLESSECLPDMPDSTIASKYVNIIFPPKNKNVNFEYLAGYQPNVSVEKWLGLSESVIDNLELGETIFVRVSDPFVNYVNKYFYIYGDK